MMEIETGKREAMSSVQIIKTNVDGTLTVIGDALNRTDTYVVHFRFRLRQSVKIVALGKISGSIVARGEKIGGHIYSVVWWAENKRYECWLYEHELEES